MVVHIIGARQGQQSYVFFVRGIGLISEFMLISAYNEQTTVVLFVHGVAISVHRNKQQSQVLFYPGWGSFVSL